MPKTPDVPAKPADKPATPPPAPASKKPEIIPIRDPKTGAAVVIKKK